MCPSGFHQRTFCSSRCLLHPPPPKLQRHSSAPQQMLEIGSFQYSLLEVHIQGLCVLVSKPNFDQPAHSFSKIYLGAQTRI
eukprot:4526210-Pleurochrysis_carterae.AAC.1